MGRTLQGAAQKTSANETPDIEPADTPLQVIENTPSKVESEERKGGWSRWHTFRGHQGRFEHLDQDAV